MLHALLLSSLTLTCHAPAADAAAPEAIARIAIPDGRFGRSVWSQLIRTAAILKISQNYPRYAAHAATFVDCAPQRQYDNFFRYHDRGKKNKARNVLRNYFGF